MAAPSTPAPALPLSIDSTVIVSPLKTPRARTPASGKKSGKGDEAATGIEWHALAVEEVFRLLETDPQKGITESEALHRQTSIFGKNLMTPPRKLSFLARVWAQVNNILIWILIGAAVVSGILSKWAEVGLIILVVVVNVAIGILQEGKAEKAAEALKAMLAPQCTVLRDGARKPVEAVELVPGDIVFLQSGDRIPADVRLCDVSKLQVLEALLTGESHPIPKHTHPVAVKAPLGDRKNLGYSATLVMSGQALGVVVETGDFTEIGKINSLVGATESGRTNLTVQLEIFGRWISAIVAVIAISTLLLAHLARGEPIAQAFTSAVAVAVAIIPEGLPAVVTIVLAIGTQAMARQHAIIKALPAVETLGSVTVICSDKTGTLTKNEMTAVAVRTAKGHYPVTGVGYEPTGVLLSKPTPEGSKDSHATAAPVPLSAEEVGKLRALLMPGVLCSDADLQEPAAAAVNVGGKAAAPSAATLWTPVGDPTEVALVTLSRKAGIANTRGQRAAIPRVATVPFESEYKFMVTGHAVTAETSSSFPGHAIGQTVLLVKGAPDRLIPRCTHQVVEDDPKQCAPIDEAFWQAQASALSKKGLRVLALCHGTLPADLPAVDLAASDVSSGRIPLTLLCLVAILDPPRDEAKTAIAEAHSAGIVVKMITGDHRETAFAIGKMLHIADDTSRAYTGPELDLLSDAQLSEVVMTCNVFARASPENKIRIVKALQSRGQITSMTGDGVNDAPALKAANIGVAMGITGTDVSKEAAKMVLADDNFATIVAAVKEGRRVWDNLVKLLTYNTPVNIAQGMTTFFAYALALEDPPLTAISTLYVNMITSVAMGMAFAFEPQEEDIMTRPPRPPGTRLFSNEVLWRNIFVGGIMIIAITGGYELSLLEGLTLEQRRGEAFTQLVFCEIAYVFNIRFLRSSSLKLDVFRGNKWIFLSIALTAALQVLIIYTPGLNTFFHSAPIPATSWGRVLGLSAAVFFAVEIEKQVLHYVRPYVYKCLQPLRDATPSALSVPAILTSQPPSALHAGAGKEAADHHAIPTGIPLPGSADPAVMQGELDKVRFIATSASSFGIPVAPAAHGEAGVAAHRPAALSTAQMLNAAVAAKQEAVGVSVGTEEGGPAGGAVGTAPQPPQAGEEVIRHSVSLKHVEDLHLGHAPPHTPHATPRLGSKSPRLVAVPEGGPMPPLPLDGGAPM